MASSLSSPPVCMVSAYQAIRLCVSGLFYFSITPFLCLCSCFHCYTPCGTLELG